MHERSMCEERSSMDLTPAKLYALRFLPALRVDIDPLHSVFSGNRFLGRGAETIKIVRDPTLLKSGHLKNLK
jgi:hypothetical protein